MRKSGFLAAVGWVLVCAAAAPAPTPVGNPRLRVEALTALNDLDAAPEQLRALHRLSRGAAAKVPAEKLPDAYRDALNEMIQAFEKDDQAAVALGQDKLDKVRDDLKIDDEPEIEATDAARERAEKSLRQFTASQIAGYLADRSDDIPSPLETLIDALDDVRGKTGGEYETLRDRTAKQVAMLLAGVDAKAGKEVESKVAAWLTKVHDLSDGDFTSKRGELEAEAKKLSGPPDPMPTLRHWIMNSLAQLLSNPELPGAIETKLKAEEK